MVLLFMINIFMSICVVLVFPRPVKMFYTMLSILWLMTIGGVNYEQIKYLMILNEDMLTISLINLSLFLICLMLLTQKTVKYMNIMVSTLYILLVSLILTFLTSNMVLMYIFFEWSLIPIFSVIMGWGYQPERLKAGILLLFYTMFASIPLLLVIMHLDVSSNSNNMNMLNIINNNLLLNISSMLLIFSVFAFLVKFPMYLVHMWLPKAHVEAPVSGSMILAGVLLKLGGYGMLRVHFLLGGIGNYTFIFTAIALLGGGILSVYCTICSDMKVMIAYSSVVHMALVIASLFLLNKWGLEGAMVIMIAHGLCSSAMFMGANLMYERTHSRSFFLNSNIASYLPSFTMFWFLVIVANFSGPFSFNMLGEILLIISICGSNKFLILILLFLSFFSACYSIILYSSTQHGKLANFFLMFNSLNSRDIHMLCSHIWPLFWLLIAPSLI